MSPRRAAPAAGEPAAPVAGEPPAAAPADRGSHPVVLVAQAPEDRLDRFLAASGRLPSRVVATRLIREGQVEVNGRPARASRALVAGDRVSFVAPPPAPSDLEPEAMALSVLYEDEHLLVIDKPAGLVVHSGGGTRSGTLVNALLARHADWPSLGGPTRPGIVHRLDKGTSGLMLVARSELALRRLSADLAARRVSRTYLAVAAGALPDPGRIEAPIGRDPRERKRMAVVENGRPSTTTFTPLRALRDATLLEVTLGSGRTHQIRVHLAAIGHPLLGDDVYGPRAGSTLIGRPALHAHRLRFRHPATEAELEFETPAPADFAALLRALGEPVAEPGGRPAARGSRR